MPTFSVLKYFKMFCYFFVHTSINTLWLLVIGIIYLFLRHLALPETNIIVALDLIRIGKSQKANKSKHGQLENMAALPCREKRFSIGPWPCLTKLLAWAIDKKGKIILSRKSIKICPEMARAYQKNCSTLHFVCNWTTSLQYGFCTHRQG